MSAPPFGGFGPGGLPAGYTGPTPAFASSFLASMSGAGGAATAATTTESSAQANRAGDATISTSMALGESTTAELRSASTAGVQTTLLTSATSSPTTPPTVTSNPSPPGPAAASETLGKTSPSPAPALTGDGHHAHTASYPLSHGALGAAVAIPIIFALLALLAFLGLRRRNKRMRAMAGPGAARMSAGGGHSAGWAGSMREKFPFLSSTFGAAAVAGGEKTHHEGLASIDSAFSGKPPMIPAPIVTSTRPNRAYFSGLDTSSSVGESRGVSGEYYAPHQPRRSEGGTFEEAPPPYRAKSLVSAGSGDSVAQVQEGSRLSPAPVPVVHMLAPSREPGTPEDAVGRSPFADPSPSNLPSASSSSDNLAASLAVRPPVSRSGSHRSIPDSRSIDSDAYSDTASVHSARAARLSVCGLGGAGGVQVIDRNSRDPFGDAAEDVGENVGGEEGGKRTSGLAEEDDGGVLGLSGGIGAARVWTP